MQNNPLKSATVVHADAGAGAGDAGASAGAGAGGGGVAPARRVAVITGGASGLGAATVTRLRAEGVTCVVFDVAEGADVRVDLTDESAVAAAATEVLAHHGRVDVLVTSAGIVGPNAPLLSTSVAEWQRTFDVNIHGTVNAIRAFAPNMVANGWGRIVTVASMAGKDGNPNLAAYSASKAAVIALTKSLGKELATTGVLVNSIAPAVIATPMNASTSDEVLAHITSLIPMKRVGEAAEVAELIAWLCSERVSFSTGAVYDISGGRATY